MATIDDDLAKAVTEGFRQAQTDIANQDLILAGTGDVTVTLADGSKKTGPSWTKLIAQAGAAGASAAAAKTSETNAKTSETNANSSKTAAASSASAAKTSETNAKTSETNAKTSEKNSKTSETNAANSASSATASLAAAQLLTSVPYEAPPYPDVWLPLNDDMRLKEGIAPYDRLTISGQVLELPTKSATFTRSTTGTYIDKSGTMRTADINEPRFERAGLLLESQATNLYTYSEQWGAGQRVATTNNSGNSPRGDKTMALLVEDTAVAEHYAQDRNIVLTSGTIYCYSVFVKAHTNSRLLYLLVATGTTAGVFFDPVAGAFVGGAVGAQYLDRGFDDLGNGVYRVWMSLTAGATQSSIFRLQLAKDGVTASYAGDGASGLYIWGAQLEAGPVPTSYIPTVVSTVTRGADYWNLSPENVGYKTLATKFKRTVAFEIVVKGAGPASSNYVDVIRVSGVTNDIICRISSANRLTSYRDGGGGFVPYVANAPGVYVHKIDGDECSSYFNGNTSTRTQAPVNNTSTAVDISNTTGPSGNTFVYHIRNFRIWHRELTVNQIKGLR